LGSVHSHHGTAARAAQVATLRQLPRPKLNAGHCVSLHVSARPNAESSYSQAQAAPSGTHSNAQAVKASLMGAIHSTQDG